MRLCKKFCSAWAVSVVDDVDVSVVEAAVEAAVLLVSAVEAVVEDAVTPSDDSACTIAPSRPPPPPEGGGGGAEVESVLFELCDSFAKRAERLASDVVRLELATELTFMVRLLLMVLRKCPPCLSEHRFHT